MKRPAFFMVAIVALCLTAIAQKQSSKTLVAYFSVTGTTEKAAKQVTEVTGGTLYEIQPAKKYTPADLDWHDKSSRSSVEMAETFSYPQPVFIIAAYDENGFLSSSIHSTMILKSGLHKKYSSKYSLNTLRNTGQ